MVGTTLDVANTIVNPEDTNVENDSTDYIYSDTTNLESLNKERDFWQYETLRKTSIPSKKSITGKVFFKRNINAKNYRIYLPINGEVFEFDFQQQLITP